MIIYQLTDLIVFVSLLASLLLLGMRKNVTHFLSLITLLYCYYDWIYLQLKDATHYEMVFISGYTKEIAIYILISALLIKSIAIKMNFLRVAISLIIILVASVIGISSQGFSDFIIGFNSYIPMLLLLFVLRVLRREIDINKYLYVVIIAVIIPNVCYSIYQYLYYTRLENFWFYDAFIHSGFALNEWDYFRGDSVRVFGFFSNTLSLTFFCFFTVLGILTYLRLGRFVFAALTITPMLLSGTRTVFISLFLYFALIFIYKANIPRKLKKYLYFGTWISAFLSTLFIILTLSSEESSLGRVVQWSDAIKELISNPLGHGIGYAGVGLTIWPDSNVIAFIYMAGVIALFTTLYIVYAYSKILSFSDNLSFLFMILSLFVAMYQNISPTIMLPIIALGINKRILNYNVKYKLMSK